MVLLIGFIPLFLYAIYAIFQLIDVNEDPEDSNVFIIQSIPSTLVTTGVLGTFIGIAIGLHYFDLSDIQSSIDELLEGLKTAFWSSIVGISLSIVASIYIKKLMMQYGELMKVPESEETKKITLMIEKLDEFSDSLAKANVDALQAAYKELITNFNDTFQELISSLVDQNFKELTNSVKSLNHWQIQNREDITNLYSKIDKLLKQSDRLVDKVEQSTKRILANIELSAISMAKIAASTTTIVGNDSLLVNIVKDLKSIASDSDNNFKAMINKLSRAITEFEEEKRQITNWLNREQGIHSSMVIYTEGLVQFTDALREFERVKEYDLNVFSQTFRQDVEHGLHQTFLQLDTLLKEYVNFLETDNAKRTVQIEFKSKKGN